MSLKLKGYQKILLFSLITFTFIFLASYQGNIGSNVPSYQSQFINLPNSDSVRPLENYYTWADNGSAVCTYTGSQISPSLVSDGAGGAIIIWTESNLLYAQRIISAGTTLWPNPRGGRVCSGVSANQLSPVICSNGQGGAIIAWQDSRNSTNDNIWIQNLDATTGNPQWGSTGKVLCTAPYTQTPSDIINNGSTGAIVVWADLRNGAVYKDIYAQRVNELGNPCWKINGIPICNASLDQTSACLCSDGAGGAIICWADQRKGDWDIYAQRILSTGVLAWTPNGTKICTRSGEQNYPRICSDGSGGAILVWPDGPAGAQDIYAQRINSAGLTQWIANGTVITNAPSTQYNPAITPDTLGGYIIAWRDDRKGNPDIYAQRINSSGQSYWTVNGTSICTLANQQSNCRICSDGHGGAYITWQDYRNGNADIYAQLINFLGQAQYKANGIAMCNASNSQGYSPIINDGTDGAIITWDDYRTGTESDIYAQRMKYVDTSGPTAPIVSSPTHPDPSFAFASPDVTLQWTLPMDASGIYNYLYCYNRNPTTIPLPGNATTNLRTVQLNSVSDGTWYFHVRGNDTWGNLGETGHFKFIIDSKCIMQFDNYTLEAATQQRRASVLADFDNDGDLDLAEGGDNHTIYLWLNPFNQSAGFDPFANIGLWRKITVGSLSTDVMELAFGDLNHDGTLDIISGDAIPGNIRIWKNNGTPWMENWYFLTIKSLGLVAPLDMDVGDTDLDGDLDIIFVTSYKQMYEFKNPYTALIDPFNFPWVENNIVNGVLTIYNLELADLNRDGWLDVVYSDGSTIRVLRNDMIGWTSIGPIITETTNFRSMKVVDLDHNGILEIVAGTDRQVLAYFSNGSVLTPGWSRTIVGIYNTASACTLYALEIGDFDSNGAPDIAAAFSANLPEPPTVYLYIYRNNKRPAYENWAKTRQGVYGGECYQITVGDLNHDGDLDLAFICQNLIIAKNIHLEINSALASNFFISSQLINFPPGIQRFRVADLDHDGDLDIIAAPIQVPRTTVTAWRNDGGGIWTSFSVYSVPFEIFSVDLGDLDKDGWLDLVVGVKDRSCYIARNDQNPWDGFGTALQIGTVISNLRTYEVAVADLDNDGNLDICGAPDAASPPSPIRIWRNNGNPFGGAWNEYRIGNANGRYGDIKVADLDRDGWADLITSDNTGNLCIWKNNKTPFANNWMTSVSMTLGASAAWRLDVVDIDNDGDLDISAARYLSGETNTQVKLLQNDGTPFDAAWSVTSVYSSSEYSDEGIACGDFDNDGWSDIFQMSHGTSPNYPKPRIFLNNHTPFLQNWNSILLGYPYANLRPLDIHTADLDFDGDLDVLVGMNNSWGVCLWKNLWDRDLTGPPAPSISSPSHPNGNAWYSSGTVSIQWVTPFDPSGISNYLYRYDQNPTTVPTPTNSSTKANYVNFTLPGEGIWYFHVRANDSCGNLGDTGHFKLKVDYTPPISGKIVYPKYGANESGVLSIQVSAADNGGGSGVAFIELYDGVPPTKLIGNTSAVYIVWNTVPETPGLHTLYLRVYDYARNMYQNATGFPIYIDNTPPTKACITSPIYNANLTGSVTITATVTDNAGGTGIQLIEFYDNASFLAFDWWAPYSYTWTPIEGLHRLTIRAYDFAGLVLNNATVVPIHIDNTDPILARVTIPVYNANVTGGLTVTAIAADNGGGTGIRYVELWDGAVLRGTDYWAPYQYSWSPTEGLHTLTVRAYDFAGRMLNNATGYLIHIDNTNPILARITAPVYNANITGGVTIFATAADNGGGTGIRYVEFYDGALLGSDYWAPYQYSWIPAAGLHTLTVRAYDFAGQMLNNVTGIPIHIDNTNPITACITFPVYNANISGSVTITATAADNGGGTGIRYVEFYDGALLGTDYWAPYQYSWAPTEGLHTLTVRAYDFAGRVLNNATGVPIHIDNTAPITACIIAPVYNANLTGVVTITATATDNGGGTGIWYVEFYDGALINRDYWAPYQYNWSPTEGLHTLTVGAFDFAGQNLENGTGVLVHIDNSDPILVCITSPVYNANVTSIISAKAIAADNINGTGIRYVEFWDGAILRSTDYWMPYQYAWIATEGLHNLTVRAYDFAGHGVTNTTGVPIHVDKNNPIMVRITAPDFNANLTGQVTVTAIAADDAGGTGIRYLSFYDKSLLLGNDYWAPYEYTWTPTVGLHNLTVYAFDFAGYMLVNATGIPLHIDNSNPITACINSPIYNANLTGEMTISVTAADNSGGTGIHYVEFYDGALLGSDYWAPYQFSWTPSEGLHTLTVCAYDFAGHLLNNNTGVPIYIDNSDPITACITAPIYDAILSGGVAIMAITEDNIGGTGIRYVEFYDSAALLSTDYWAPYEYAWAAPPEGIHSLTVRAYDFAGRVLTNATAVPIRIDNTDPITVCIISPVYNANLTGDLTIIAIAADNVGGSGIQFVEFLEDFSVEGVDYSAPYEYIWSMPSEGTYSLTVRAFDFAGHWLENTTIVLVRIDNTDPTTACITSPVYNANLTGTITIRANAADGGSGIQYVEFYDGAGLLGSDYWAPYQYTWTPIEGLHTLTVCAYDFAGRVLNNATIVPIHVDNTPPSLSIVFPVVNGLNIFGSTLWLNGTASDPNTMVTSIRCNDSRFDLYKMPTIGNPAYAYRNNTVILGIVQVRINATDVLGYVQNVARWFNSISVPTPNVIITSPTNGAMINPSTIWINGTTEAGKDQTITEMLINNPSFTSAINLIGQPSGAFGYYNTSNIADGGIIINITTVNGLGRVSYALVTFTLDTVAPIASSPTPQNQTCITNPTPNIAVNLIDLLSGINVSSIQMRVNGTPVPYTWNGLTVNWIASPAFLDGRVVLVVVDATDMAQNAMETCKWIFTVDLLSPTASNAIPQNNTFVNDPIPNIAVDLQDMASGINASSLIMRVNGALVSHTWDGVTISWMSLINYADNSLINVTVDACDNIGHAMPTYRWAFRIDLTPPVASGETPADGIYITDPTPEISLTIADSFAGVNGSSIVMRINGTPVSPVWNGLSVNYTAGPYASGIKLDITVNARDNAGNALPTKSWTFFIDTLAPTVNVVVPTSWAIYTGGVGLSIVWTVLDQSPCTVIIEYSTNNGSSWQEISGSYSHANDGTELWTLPLVDAALCLVRVQATDFAGLTNMDQSDNAFLIFTTYPDPIITAPALGGVVRAGTSSNILWMSIKGVSPRTVLIEYSTDNGQNWQPINSGSYSHADDGSEPWNVPSTESTQCRIRINVTDQASHMRSTVSGLFTLDQTSPTCEIFFAEGNPTFTGGSTQSIIWSSSDLTTVTIKLEYSVDNGGSWQEINEGMYSHINDGTESWKIPSVEAEGCLVRITATDAAGHSTVDITGFFSIIKPAPTSDYWIYIILIGGAVAAIAVTVLYRRSRKPAVSGTIQRPKWIGGVEATFPTEMALPDKIEMIISKGIPLEDIADPEIKKLLETPMGGISVETIETLRKLSIPAEELRQIIAEVSVLSPEEQIKFIEDLSKSTAN